jgi:hypothetical protein
MVVVMTATPTPTAPAAPTPLFGSLRIDPQKASGGTWVRHPESGDEFLVRRRWCAEHARAWIQATADWEAQHGESGDTPEGRSWIEATAIATGLVADWRLAGDSRPYDRAAMAAAMADPQLSELRTWVLVQAEHRGNFRPDATSGN